MQPEILTALHKGHPEIKRMKLAREYVYWPKISSDIEHIARQCDLCSNTKIANKGSTPQSLAHSEEIIGTNAHRLRRS